MTLALDILSWILLMGGGFFSIVGAVGVLRMPDFYARTHPATIPDTMGATLMIAGLMVQAGLSLLSVKLAFILAFLLLTSPTSAYALVKAAYAGGVKFEGEGADPE